VQHYKVNFAPVLKWLFLLFLLVLTIKVRSKQTLKTFFSHSEASILGLFFIPLLLHHALLFNFTAIHDFSTAKAAAPLGILAAILFQKLRKAATYKWPMIVLFGIVSAYFWSRSIEQYYIMNKASYDASYFQKVGLCIQKQSEATDVIVLKQGTIYVSSGAPQFMYYSQRNALSYWGDTILINELTKNRNHATAVLFDIPWQNGTIADSILTRKIK